MTSRERATPLLQVLILVVAINPIAYSQEILSTIVSNAVFVTDSDSLGEAVDSDRPLIDLQIDAKVDHSPGALLLCGGGPLPNDVLELFFNCGNREQGKLVVIPSASRAADSGDFSQGVNIWKTFNWENVDVLHAFDRAQAEAENFAEKLTTATAVWISGGDQNRLSKLYQGTAVEREIRNVMLRGGVVGGTSAGSAIATRIMISGGATRPQLSPGLDLLPNAIIDQHFSQRSRFERLANAVAEHPDRVGIGIDESTGLLVKHKGAEVVGNGAVYVYAKQERPVSVVRTVATEPADVNSSAGTAQSTVLAEGDRLPLKFSNGQTINGKRIPLVTNSGDEQR